MKPGSVAPAARSSSAALAACAAIASTDALRSRSATTCCHFWRWVACLSGYGPCQVRRPSSAVTEYVVSIAVTLPSISRSYLPTSLFTARSTRRNCSSIWAMMPHGGMLSTLALHGARLALHADRRYYANLRFNAHFPCARMVHKGD